MKFTFDERSSDSPLVEKIWYSHSSGSGSFLSVAASRCEVVVTKHKGKLHFTMRGPETSASTAYVPDDHEALGIVFKLGAFMPHFPASKLMNRKDITLPEATNQSFWLLGSAWQFPTFENADTFVNRLINDRLLIYEPIVDAVIRGHQPDMSLRSIQRRFLNATGLTYRTIHQIERARRAVILLQQGRSILDTAYELGYFDQAHLTKSLKHFIGQTPTQLIDQSKAERLSLLYKTDAFLVNYDTHIDFHQQRRAICEK